MNSVSTTAHANFDRQRSQPSAPRSKADFKELKEKQIKEVLNDKLWLFQRGLMEKAQMLLNCRGYGAVQRF